MTELGQRMLPLLRQCYDSALGARSLASAIKSGEVSSLRIALSETIDVLLLMPHILELQRHFNSLEIKLLRGTGAEIAGLLKGGEVELAIASSLEDDWDRLDHWPLFSERFELVADSGHWLAARDVITFAELSDEQLLMRTHCEQFEYLAYLLRSRDLKVNRAHHVPPERDLAVFLDQRLGVSFAPRSASIAAPFMRATVSELDFRRTVFVYGVAGRQRTPVAGMILKMLRGADWSRYAN